MAIMSAQRSTTTGRHFVVFKQGNTGFSPGQSLRILNSEPPWLSDVARPTTEPFPDNPAHTIDIDQDRAIEDERVAAELFRRPILPPLDRPQVRQRYGWADEEINLAEGALGFPKHDLVGQQQHLIGELIGAKEFWPRAAVAQWESTILRLASGVLAAMKRGAL